MDTTAATTPRRNWRALSRRGFLKAAMFGLGASFAPTTGLARPSSAAQAKLVAFGDLMLGRRLRPLVRENGGEWLFAGVRSLLDADLSLANLESPLADPPPGASPALNLAAGSDAHRTLAASGLRVASLANNHALDAGAAGLAATIDHLERTGILAVGAGPTSEAAIGPQYVQANGLRIAVLAACDVPPNYQPSGGVPLVALLTGGGGSNDIALEHAIGEARRQADAVVLVIHWGEEYTAHITRRQRQLATLALAAGVDVVVGSHPHVVQPVEIHDGRVVAFSLGNFIFDQTFSRATTQGLALQVSLGTSGPEVVEAIPLDLASGRPQVSGSAQTVPEVTTFQWDGEDFRASRRWVFFATPAPEGDIDGDGAVERAEVSDGGLRAVRQRAGGQEELWHSDPGWEVERVAIGDVDGDGRAEVVFTLWRVYQGRYGNQPFVFGWRDGEMRPVWRGSPLSEPIRELAVDDVDGDGLKELVVLEGSLDGERHWPAIWVAVWRWSGWGFVLQWRSRPGRYSNLRTVCLGDNAGCAAILVDGGPD